MRSLVAFILGVFIGQEYGNLIPNIKNESIKFLENIKKNVKENK